MSLRDTLRRAAGLLVELPPEVRPAAPEPAGSASSGGSNLDQLIESLEAEAVKRAEEPATRTVEQVVRDAAGPNLEDISVPGSTPQPTLGADGKLDFSVLYRQALLPAAPFSAEQMLGMLESLPHELPLDTKRRTVAVSLDTVGKSIGATPETIVADASRKLAALAAYADNLSKDTAGFVAATELEVAALQAQIEEKRQAIRTAQAKLQDVMAVCSAESDRLDDVLEFFSLDVPPSKYAPAP
jgi:hypothetical protein